ncbi:MAG: O-antigen ligase family protein [Nocardioides sp.]
MVRAIAAAPSLPAIVFLCLYLTLLLVVPAQLIFRPLGAPGTPANLLGMGGLLWWSSVKVGGWMRHRGSPVGALLGISALSVLTSYALANAAGWWAPSNMRQRTDDVWTLAFPNVDLVHASMTTAVDRGLLSYAAWLGIAVLALDGVRGWRDIQRMLRWLVWLATLFAAVGIIQFYTGTNLASFIRIPGLVPNSEVGASLTRSVLNRVSSTSTHPIEFGVMLATIFPLALHTAIFRSRRWELMPAVVIGFAVPLAVSRSGMLSLAIGLIVMFVWWPPARRRRALLITPVAVVLMRLAVPGLVGTIYSLFRGVAVDPSVTGRTSDYGVVLSLFAHHPWFGRGLFSFVPRYYRILDNQLLMILLELGLVGLVVVLSMFITAFFSGLGARRRAADPENQHAALAVTAALAGIFVSYLTFDAWGYAQVSGMSFLLVGLCGAVLKHARLDQEAEAVVRAADTRNVEARP